MIIYHVCHVDHEHFLISCRWQRTKLTYLYLCPFQVRAEIRDPDAKHGLGMDSSMTAFHMDPSSSTAKSQKIKKRYNDIVGRQKDSIKKKRRKDLERIDNDS